MARLKRRKTTIPQGEIMTPAKAGEPMPSKVRRELRKIQDKWLATLTEEEREVFWQRQKAGFDPPEELLQKFDVFLRTRRKPSRAFRKYFMGEAWRQWPPPPLEETNVSPSSQSSSASHRIKA